MKFDKLKDMHDQRTALITGGAKRVGRAIVERLAKAGFRVLFTFRHSGADAGSVANQITSAGGIADCLQVDLESADAVATIAAWVRATTSRLDVLVNNASLYLPDREANLIELSRRHQRVNFEVPLQLTHALSPLLKGARGHVVNMLDVMAEKPMPRYATYCASKAALANATLGLARELAPEVTVNGIAPGVVDWPDDMPLEDREKYLLKVPLRRAGTPQDAANLVHFLATEGTYITGQSIRLDGGRSIA